MIAQNFSDAPDEGVIRLLFLGDVVGEKTRKAITSRLPKIKEEFHVDFVVVNGENAAGGRGITPKLCIELMRAGAAVVTTGDHVWDQKEILSHFEIEPRLLRPCNWPEGTPGKGNVILETKKGKVGVINVQGRSFMQAPLENPFLRVQEEVDRVRQETPVILVDFHAEATSEKVAMGWHLDGMVSVVVGTHTHVATADERLLPEGTAFQSDAGMCGPEDSIIGSQKEPILERFKTLMPVRFAVAKGPIQLNGLMVDVEVKTGKAKALSRFRERWIEETTGEIEVKA